MADNRLWGSDVIAEALRACGFGFAALNPGASYRGLHDSFVNHAPGRMDLAVCLHEEHAVALAHGWTKVTGRPALAIVHSNVGLLHAAMAVYNAWADRAPVVLLGAGGAMDARRRRPWIEWIHTVQDQAAIVRPYTKWDDQPASALAAVRSVAEGAFIAAQAPQGPVYICLDVTDQETPVEAPVDIARLTAVPAVARPAPAPAAARRLADALAGARRPVFVFGRVSRDADDWAARVALAEATGARVMTDIRSAAAFPTDHPAHVGAPGFGPDAAQAAMLAQADAVVLFDPVDPATTLSHVSAGVPCWLASPDLPARRGWVKDAHPLVDTGTLLPVPPDALAPALLPLLPLLPPAPRAPWPVEGGGAGGPDAHSLGAPAVFARIAAGIAAVRETAPVTLTRLPLSWPGGLLPFRHPLDYIGRDGGEGLASGPGIAVGAALALKGTGRLPVAVLGDGDFMMGATALWTAANLGLPLLVVVCANGVYGNDVVHQERVARARGRDVENRWVGQMLNDPELGIAQIAAGLGAVAAERVDQDAPGLEQTLARLAETALRQGGVALLEVMMPAR